jgi:hypothetical protein
MSLKHTHYELISYTKSSEEVKIEVINNNKTLKPK